MPPVEGIAPVQLPSSGGHDGHGANAATLNGGAVQSFSATLVQAISHAPAGGGDAALSANAASHSGGHNAGGTPNGSFNPRHFPIGESSHGEDHDFQELALGLRAYRQQLIASNIANADTPNYKAVDIDFQEALRIARSVANTSPLTLSTTAAGHISGQTQSSAPPYPLKHRAPSQPSADGNTVEMDVERAKFAENAVMYEFSLQRVSSHYKMMMELLNNIKQ